MNYLPRLHKYPNTVPIMPKAHFWCASGYPPDKMMTREATRMASEKMTIMASLSRMYGCFSEYLFGGGASFSGRALAKYSASSYRRVANQCAMIATMVTAAVIQVSMGYGRCGATANDLKLSEPRGWRDRCAAGGEGGGPEAAGVTAARVRCSAWLGVAAVVICASCLVKVRRVLAQMTE